MLTQVCKFSSLGLLLAVFLSTAQAQTTEPRKGGNGVERDRSTSPTGNSQYSDRDRKAGWDKGKQELERALKAWTRRPTAVNWRSWGGKSLR